MAEVNQRVMQMVEEEVRKNPRITTAELFEKAKKTDKTIAKLSARQFNARYPLQVKRRLSPPRRRRSGGRRRRSSAAEATRAAVRQVLLKFAQEVAGASPGQVVAVVAEIDGVVDQVIKATSRR